MKTKRIKNTDKEKRRRRRENKERLYDFMMGFLYETDKVFSLYSLKRTLYFEYHKVLENEERDRVLKAKRSKKINNAITYLKNSGLLENNKSDEFRLSKKGRVRSIYLISKRYKRKRKDRSEFLVIFDIPEDFRKARALFRQVLYNFGAEMVQRSVFKFRGHETGEYLRRIVKEAGIKKFVKFVSVKKID